ncbi:hypothetical protein FB464_1522 [Subtercola boreus]|nr:hypothetical protein FB464_1522 [Subtercola boreus]
MPERPLPIPDPVLFALWRVVEVSVFVVLIVKDRRVPAWNCPTEGPGAAARGRTDQAARGQASHGAGGQTTPNHSLSASTSPALLPQPTHAT